MMSDDVVAKYAGLPDRVRRGLMQAAAVPHVDYEWSLVAWAQMNGAQLVPPRHWRKLATSLFILGSKLGYRRVAWPEPWEMEENHARSAPHEHWLTDTIYKRRRVMRPGDTLWFIPIDEFTLSDGENLEGVNIERLYMAGTEASMDEAVGRLVAACPTLALITPVLEA